MALTLVQEYPDDPDDDGYDRWCTGCRKSIRYWPGGGTWVHEDGERDQRCHPGTTDPSVATPLRTARHR